MRIKPARSRLAILAAALVAGLALVAVPPGGARADGEGDGEGGAEGAEGTGEKPTLDGALEVSDLKKRVIVKVPKSWKPPEGFEPQGTCVAAFVGPVTAGSGGQVALYVEPEFSRALLAVSSRVRHPAEGDTRSGPGWAETAGPMAGSGGQSLWCWERALEKDGGLLVVRVFSVAQVKDEAKELARQILDTAKAGTQPPKAAPPSGVTVKKTGDYDVWTDSDDKGKVARVVELAAPARDVLVKALKGKPFDESRPVLRAYQVGALYMDALKPIYGTAPDYAAFDPSTRSAYAQLYRVDDKDDFPMPMREMAAHQYLVQYFGGSPPLWIAVGLRRYAAMVAQTGKVDKPPPAAQEGARTGVAMKCKRLDEWMDTTGDLNGTDATAAATELWAWHYFMRHGPSKKYQKQYQTSLDALRQTGDLAASQKAWEGVDFTAMQGEFKAWCLGWK